MKFNSGNKSFSFKRYPPTTNRSLQPWNAADELMLDHAQLLITKHKKIAIYNDRFGFLSCFFAEFQPTIIIDHKSQEKAIRKNLKANDLSFTEDPFQSPLSPFSDMVDVVLIKIPKSLDLFRLYLYRISQNLKKDAIVICGFMTKYFSPQMLTIANEFFEYVEQSKARKKARLMILKEPKASNEISIIHNIPLDENTPDPKIFRQYFGVFSANNIDIATQFLIGHLKVKEADKRILDVACGNGILAYAVQKQAPDRELHLLDDSMLAIESAKLNLDNGNTHYHFNDTLDDFENDYFDLIVSNPPFHFEFETNIEVSVNLFQQVNRCLKPAGRFLCVGNRHLNYKTHLEKIFDLVSVIAENEKFVIYSAS